MGSRGCSGSCVPWGVWGAGDALGTVLHGGVCGEQGMCSVEGCVGSSECSGSCVPWNVWGAGDAWGMCSMGGGMGWEMGMLQELCSMERCVGHGG